VALTATPSRGIQSYPGGTAVWVVEVTALDAAPTPIEITAKSAAGVGLEANPRTLNGSGLVEVIARPGVNLVGHKVDVVVTARRGERAASASASNRIDLPLQVLRYEDALAETARQEFEPFVTHLAASHLEFGIDQQTDWQGWVSAPNILVVMWYSFMSADWEALVQWHVMIPPYDWTHVYLRPRGSLDCTWAGEIPTGGAPVEEVVVPEVFPRFEAPWIDLGPPMLGASGE